MSISLQGIMDEMTRSVVENEEKYISAMLEGLGMTVEEFNEQYVLESRSEDITLEPMFDIDRNEYKCYIVTSYRVVPREKVVDGS